MNFCFDNFYSDLEKHDLNAWQEKLPSLLSRAFQQRQHGKRDEWQALLSNLPELNVNYSDIATDKIRIGHPSDISDTQRNELTALLKQLHPWRKGPYELFGIHIDTEWRSDWKWQRIHKHVSPLKNRRVLDIGCGNGYHMWRMLADGAQLVVGADPSQFFLVQFQTIKKYLETDEQSLPIYLLPLKSEELPEISTKYQGKGFDTVFSMGVLYHRVSPIHHLQELKSFLRPGGELVLETLIIDGEDQHVLLPENRYAQMRNVWFLPTPVLLVRMLERVGFKNVNVVDVNQTSIEEQRKTDWMMFDSFENFLDPEDHNKTIEGYPAPKRVVIVCSNG